MSDSTIHEAPARSVAAPSKLKIFGQRLTSTLILWALLGGAFYFKLGWPFLAFASILGLGAFWEFMAMDRSLPRANRLWVFAVAVAYYSGLFLHFNGLVTLQLDLLDALAALLVLCGLFIPAFLRPLEGRQTLWHILYPAFGYFYIIYLFSFMLRLLFTSWDAAHPNAGMIYALFVVAATKFTDSGAYAIGMLFGKHKMIPHISPGKTWEGLGGAFLGAAVAGMITKWCAGDNMGLLGYGETLIICLAIAIICVAGDLAESLIKRCLEIKDSGRTLPGIGGAFDLVDSLLWTAPALYLYLRYVS